MSDRPVARPLPTHRTPQILNKRIHTYIDALSGIRTHNSLDRATTVTSNFTFYCSLLAAGIHIEFEALTAVVKKRSIFWDVTPYSLLKYYYMEQIRWYSQIQ
jgi:hypothetical protein